MKYLLLIIIIFLSFLTVEAQEYTDLYPDTRAPYRFRIYEREVLAANEIDHIQTIWVSKYMNAVWLRGAIPFTGDTTKLTYMGLEQDADFEKKRKFENPDSVFCPINYPVFTLRDTIYVRPTYDGFLVWKEEHGYN